MNFAHQIWQVISDVLPDVAFIVLALAGLGYLMPEALGRLERSRSLRLTIAAVFIFLGCSAVVVNHRSRGEQEARQSELDKKLDVVAQQNTAIISSLKSTPQQPELSAKPNTGPAPISSQKPNELKRRQGILAALRNEYILSHDNLSPGLLAGTEMPPSDWMNKRLQELGEKWSFSNDPKTEARLQLKTLFSKGENLRKQGCTRLNPQNYQETAPFLLTSEFFDWIQNVTADIEIGEPDRLAEWHKAVIWTNASGNALGVECTDFSLKLRTLQAIIEQRATEFSTPEQKAALLPALP